MTLSDLASIGSLVSGIAVLVSLVYLSLQVKQSERNQQASIRQGRVARTIELNIAQMEPSAAEAIERVFEGSEDVSSTQLLQFRSWSRATFYNAEDGFYQHNDGLLNDVAFDNLVGGWRITFGFPAMRETWKSVRSLYGHEFVEFMDKIVCEVPVAPQIDRLAKWKTDIAAEKAMAAQ